jgi:hypothetical protein
MRILHKNRQYKASCIWIYSIVMLGIQQSFDRWSPPSNNISLNIYTQELHVSLQTKPKIRSLLNQQTEHILLEYFVTNY